MLGIADTITERCSDYYTDYAIFIGINIQLTASFTSLHLDSYLGYLDCMLYETPS